MKRLWIAAMIGLAGCGEAADRSRLEVGQKAIAFSADGDWINVTPVGGGIGPIRIGTTLTVVRDEGDESRPLREIRVRVDDKPPWTGEAYRKDLRPAK